MQQWWQQYPMAQLQVVEDRVDVEAVGVGDPVIEDEDAIDPPLGPWSKVDEDWLLNLQRDDDPNGDSSEAVAPS